MDERWLTRGLLALVLLCNAWVLYPEIEISRVDLNDSVFHYTIADSIVSRVNSAKQPLDFWMNEWTFGYPVVRDYQPLAHWLVALTHFATFQQFPLESVFAVLRWLMLAIFPLSAYVACRWMGFSRPTALATAILSPLVASPNLYGIEYGSYVWRGNGLYTQLVASHLFVIAVGAGLRAIRDGRRIVLAAGLLALTFLAHFIYGYMAAATVILAAAMPAAGVTPRRRLIRLGFVGFLSFGLAASQILPMLGDGPFINRSRWEPVWKWESFGLAEVLGLTASGDLLDAKRLPMLTLLALFGAVAIIRRRKELDEERPAATFALAAAALWIFLFCGRAAWGALFTAIGLSDAAQLHRFIGGAQWFLVIVAGAGLSRLWTLPLRNRWRYPSFAAAALTLIVLWSPVAERLHFLNEGYGWGRENLNTYRTHRDSLNGAVEAARAAGGRAYPGLAAAWGAQFRVGYVPFYAFLSKAHVPAVAFLYHSMALTSDLMVRFDENRPEHYRLFNIRSVISETSRQLPAFLRPGGEHGPFRVLTAPPSTLFQVVGAPRTMYVDRSTFYEVNDAWLQSGWVASGTHLLLHYETTVRAPARPRLYDTAALMHAPPASRCTGSVSGETQTDGNYRAVIDAAGDCFALFKMTYHPNWTATVDGVRAHTVMLTPGFVGIKLPPGRHAVQMQYTASPMKPLLLLLTLPLLVGAYVAQRRGALARAEEKLSAVNVPWNADIAAVLLLAALVLPCIAPFARGVQPLGHDATEYLPRVIEFHENIRHGILLPRWSQNLSSGQGQPLFLFNPPLFYYATELFHLLGMPFVTAMNAATIALILASAATMFLLARWYFGPLGGVIGAVAYVYAPYFLVDLYVRTAFAEFSAFPLYPLAFYGFARYADGRGARHLAIGLLAYAGVWFAHSPAAVLFSPLLGAFILFLAWRASSWRLVFIPSAAIAVSLMIAAPIWVPGVIEAVNTHANLLTEGPLKYSNHYVLPSQFFATKWGYGVSLLGTEDGMPFTLGWPQLLLGAIAAIAIGRSASEQWKQWFIFFSASAFVLCFLMTQRSHTLWETLKPVQYVAFPWRIMAPTIFCLALLAAAVTVALELVPAEWRRHAYAAAIALIVITALPNVRAQSYIATDPLLWTPQQIAARGVIPATFDTFEPRWVLTRPNHTDGSVAVTNGSAAVQVTQRTPIKLRATIHATSTADLQLPIAYFPGWHVTIDGQEQAVDRPSVEGRMRVTTAPGVHQLEATFRRTPLRWFSDLTALAGLLIVAAFVFISRRTPAATEPAAAQPAARAQRRGRR